MLEETIVALIKVLMASAAGVLAAAVIIRWWSYSQYMKKKGLK